MNRRTFFALAASTGVLAVIPAVALAKSAPPDVYLARCENRDGYEIETWRHTTDRGWVQIVCFSPGEFEYHERHAWMSEHYVRGRAR